MRAPGPWHKVVFTVLFTTANVPESAWETVREPGDRKLGRLPLQNGESVWVAVRRAPLEPNEKAEAEKLAGELRIHMIPGSSPNGYSWRERDALLRSEGKWFTDHYERMFRSRKHLCSAGMRTETPLGLGTDHETVENCYGSHRHITDELVAQPPCSLNASREYAR
jgi:hypothetical protein